MSPALQVVAWVDGEPHAEAEFGDTEVVACSPGDGDRLRAADGLNSPALVEPGAVTVLFSSSLDLMSVIDPNDVAQGSRNIRLFRETDTGRVLVRGTTIPATTCAANDTLLIRPFAPLPAGRYVVRVGVGVRGAGGNGIKGDGHSFSFHVD